MGRKTYAHDNFNEKNIKDTRRYFENKKKKAKRDAKLGIPPEQPFGMINAGPGPCKVTITKESRKISAETICKV